LYQYSASNFKESKIRDSTFNEVLDSIKAGGKTNKKLLTLNFIKKEVIMIDPYLKDILNYYRRRSMSFTEFVENFIQHPEEHLLTSSNLISDTIKYFGFEIVVRAGQPMISYNIFKIFSPMV
jgi:hypothetical protein